MDILILCCHNDLRQDIVNSAPIRDYLSMISAEVDGRREGGGDDETRNTC